MYYVMKSLLSTDIKYQDNYGAIKVQSTQTMLYVKIVDNDSELVVQIHTIFTKSWTDESQEEGTVNSVQCSIWERTCHNLQTRYSKENQHIKICT